MSGRDPADVLSPMQFAVSKLAAEYRTNDEIAVELLISKRTVKFHMDIARKKLRLATKRDLARVMKEWGH